MVLSAAMVSVPMRIETVLSTLQESDAAQYLTDYWDQAQAAMPSERPAFLEHDQIRAAWDYGSFAQPLSADLLQLADRINDDPALRAMAWFLYWRVFEGPHDTPRQWPEFSNYLGDRAGMFYLVIALAHIPAVRAYHKTLSIPESITSDTCRQVSCYVANYQRGTGQLGIYRRQLGWLGNYLPPNLYLRLGRFEFWRQPHDRDYTMYRHTGNGATVVLSPDGTEYTADGHRCFDPKQPPAGIWQAAFRETDDAFIGNPISPTGTALPEVVSLPKSEWICVLKPGDTVLDMHIPAGGDMTPEACASSLRHAAAFFRDRFPDAAPKAITCASWMFSAQLEECLPADSNLVKLVKEVYVFPLSWPANEGLWFVFLQPVFNPTTAPRNTSLQRAILDYLAKGQPWRCAGMILLVDDLKDFGTQAYRRRWSSKAIRREMTSA